MTGSNEIVVDRPCLWTESYNILYLAFRIIAFLTYGHNMTAKCNSFHRNLKHKKLHVFEFQLSHFACYCWAITLLVLDIINRYKMICLDSPPLWTSEIKTSYTPSKIQCNLLGPDNQVGHSSPVLDISCNYKKN